MQAPWSDGQVGNSPIAGSQTAYTRRILLDVNTASIQLAAVRRTPTTQLNQRPMTPDRAAAYRRLAVTILGLDVPTVAFELSAARARQRRTQPRAA